MFRNQLQKEMSQCEICEVARFRFYGVTRFGLRTSCEVAGFTNLRGLRDSMNKQEAAEYLGVSVRTLENMMKPEHPNAVRFSYVKGKTRDVADFGQDELDRAKAKMPTGAAPLVVGAVEEEKPRNSETSNLAKVETSHLVKVATPQTPNLADARFFVIPVEEMNALVERVGQGNELQGLAVKPLLQASEINTLYGIPEREVRAAMKDGALPSAKIGRSQKARRGDVDAWINRRFEG
jgi:hypothetical protein